MNRRHEAAMLVHNIASGIAALDDLPPKIALENAEALHECFTGLGEFLLRMGEREEAKNEQLRQHQ